jgi:hypothetical protein
VLQGRTLG